MLGVKLCLDARILSETHLIKRIHVSSGINVIKMEYIWHKPYYNIFCRSTNKFIYDRAQLGIIDSY